MFVCVCSAVTDSQIIDAVDEGVTSFDAMQDHLGVAKACGTCSCEVKTLLQNKLAQSLSSRVGQAITVPASRLSA